MRVSIQNKLFLALTGLTLMVLAGVLYAVTTILAREIEKDVIAGFRNTQQIFREQQSLIYDRLVESSYLISENSTFKANVTLADPRSVNFSIDEYAAFTKVDLFVVTDKNGKVLGRLSEPEKYGDDLSVRSTVFEAMQGAEPDSVILWPELWGIAQNLFQVVSLPVYAGESIVGTLTLGTLFTSVEARSLKGAGNIDISIFYNDRIIGSTIGNELHRGIEDMARKNRTAIDTVLQFASPTPAFIDTLNGVAQFVFISPLGRGEKAYYIATVPAAEELTVLNTIRENIFYIAASFLLLTLLLAFFLGRTFSLPIQRLARGMEKVTAGHLDIRITPSTRDEIGTLTETFNEMIQGLRERLHLSKYVGRHTLDMVSGVATDEMALGGTRQELAVLFSDIRGFTAYSENRSPEEVIAMLNRYLGFQAEIVEQYDGSVDKFVGDEMFALFSGEQATERAVQCAFDIQERVKREHENDPVPIYIGIGINYGAVILGNMGAEKRMDYTALGATVNMGARLCGAAAAESVLLPKPLADSLKIPVKIKEVYLMAFKGFSEKIKIAEVARA
ncbi:MAG TPA: HAMP domain-containing protein [Caldithrix abyssi]|uniref:HAMP domain-containing protein n=1 Tax=Caldithrix abyssi TaxID=187145 RepID=A0A7V5VF18_CALAY|nr:HAMP domain-containing protein [Caldithrix abyssi]